MNWLTNFVRPKLRALVRKPDIPDNLWEKCRSCERMVFHRDLEANLFVCQHCGFHLRLGPKERFASLFDDGEYQRVELPEAPHDVLKFRDKKRYADRLKEARSRTGESDAVIVAHGKMDGLGVVVAVFDFGFLGGSMGVAVGEAIIAAARHATARHRVIAENVANADTPGYRARDLKDFSAIVKESFNARATPAAPVRRSAAGGSGQRIPDAPAGSPGH